VPGPSPLPPARLREAILLGYPPGRGELKPKRAELIARPGESAPGAARVARQSRTVGAISQTPNQAEDSALPVIVEGQQDGAVTERFQTGDRVPIMDLVSGNKSIALSDVQVAP